MKNKIITAIFTMTAALSCYMLISDKEQSKPVPEQDSVALAPVYDNYGHLTSYGGNGDYVENGNVIAYK